MARSIRPAPPRARDGRERLLDTAERLFAERGIRGVSLREITEAAGQRNASVVQYHFGSRAGLVAAVVERHMATVDAARSARLDAATAGGRAPGRHEAMRILVEPLAECLRTESGRAYLRIVQHLVDEPSDAPGPPPVQANPSLRRVSRLLEPATAPLPPRIRSERHHLTTSFLLRALADRAAELDRHGHRRPALGHDAFVANLVDVLVAVLTARPSTASAE